MATQTYGSTNPLLQTPAPTPWNVPVQAPAPTPIQSAPAPQVAAPVASPVIAPEPTVGETLQGIKTKALTIQDQINQMNLAGAPVKGGKYQAVTLEQGNPDPSKQAPINESAIAQNQMRLFQTEIDATNKVYDQLYNQKVLEGTGRLGSLGARQARGGLLGSSFGAAAEDTLTNANTAEQQAVQNERQAKIGSIMGKVRTAVADDIAAKRLARTQDADALIAYHANRKQTRQTNIDMISHSLLQQGLDPSTMTPDELDAIGKEAGISAQDIIASYAQTKQIQDASTAATALKTKKTNAEISQSEASVRKIDADIASGKLISLGEGSVLYNTETGETFKNPKTYAPKKTGISGDMTPGQVTAFNSIVGKYNASPLVAAADRTVVLKNSIEKARTNPSDGATQLNLVYSYIQALDTYQSAVREGELGLVNSIDSKVGKLGNFVTQIQNGQIVRPEVAKQMADAAENLVSTINEGASRKAKSFESQANTVGLGDAWKEYTAGFQTSYNQSGESSGDPEYDAYMNTIGK